MGGWMDHVQYHVNHVSCIAWMHNSWIMDAQFMDHGCSTENIDPIYIYIYIYIYPNNTCLYMKKYTQNRFQNPLSWKFHSYHGNHSRSSNLHYRHRQYCPPLSRQIWHHRNRQYERTVDLLPSNTHASKLHYFTPFPNTAPVIKPSLCKHRHNSKIYDRTFFSSYRTGASAIITKFFARIIIIILKDTILEYNVVVVVRQKVANQDTGLVWSASSKVMPEKMLICCPSST